MTTDRDREAFEANQFRKKPVVVEARQFCVTALHKQQTLADWCGGLLRGTKLPPDERVIRIPTLEGEMEASFGDWIICGVKGEFYPCKPDIFAATYEAAHAREAGAQEPVAWRYRFPTLGGAMTGWLLTDVQPRQGSDVVFEAQPLYTHPAGRGGLRDG